MPGYFAQSSSDTDFSTFNFTDRNFGLTFPPNGTHSMSTTSAPEDLPLTPSLTPGEKVWPAFRRHVSKLIAHISEGHPTAPRRELKILYIVRHGEGVHNVAESQYGTPEWNAHWARLPGDGKLNWTDAELTAEGRAQADRAGTYWRTQVSEEGMQAPEGGYVSPLGRCLDTAQRVFGKLYDEDDEAGGFKPLVKENLRETNGVHMCDRRSSRTWIHEHYPTYAIEDSLTETDELWSPTYRETHDDTDIRLGGLLDEIFDHDQRVWLGLTCHSGAGAALMRVLGHRLWRIRPGEIVPVFVEATELS